jgi:hypothetical protein
MSAVGVLVLAMRAEGDEMITSFRPRKERERLAEYLQ